MTQKELKDYIDKLKMVQVVDYEPNYKPTVVTCNIKSIDSDKLIKCTKYYTNKLKYNQLYGLMFKDGGRINNFLKALEIQNNKLNYFIFNKDATTFLVEIIYIGSIYVQVGWNDVDGLMVCTFEYL